MYGITALNQWGLIISSGALASTTVTITPGNNAYGSYVQLIAGASVTDDAFAIVIGLSAGAVSGSARDTLVKIGVDPSGGTTYTDYIVDLAASCAGSQSVSGGIWYQFPLYFKAGTSVAIAASVNNVTVGTILGYCRLYCRPSEPVRSGTFVRTFGSVPASSSGTAFTTGVPSKGSYTALGTTADRMWYWALGICCNQSVMSAAVLYGDLAIGDGTTRYVVVSDQLVIPNAVEAMSYNAVGGIWHNAIGDIVHVRGGAPLAVTTGYSAIAYGVGG